MGRIWLHRVYLAAKYIAETRSIIFHFIHSFIGFGAGRRQCPGELLARSRIFLLLANILQKFDVEPADGEIPERDVRGYTMGVIVKPPPVSARFKLRLQ